MLLHHRLCGSRTSRVLCSEAAAADLGTRDGRPAVVVKMYACWNLNHSSIGDKLEMLAVHVDYISRYSTRISVRNTSVPETCSHPREIVHLSLQIG